MKQELPKRKPMRLKHHDYSTPGAYFITICTHRRMQILSTVGAVHEPPEIQLTEQGRIVDRIINNLPPHLGVEIDRYVIMPNHIHLIIVITDSEKLRAIRESPLQGRSIISKVIGYIKMNASKAIHGEIGEGIIWQRLFYDHVIRNYDDYANIVNYIVKNPDRWKQDRFYCENG